MNQFKQLSVVLLLSFLTACANGIEEGSEKAPASNTANPPVTIQPAKPQQTAPATTGSAALNPAHGQPGHRCDIQVGAPLNSAPAQAATIPPAQQPTIVVPPTTTTAAGKNPPHGQPGHRCDIAVGAALPKQ